MSLALHLKINAIAMSVKSWGGSVRFYEKKSVLNKEGEIWWCNGNLFERRNFDSSKAPFIGLTCSLPACLPATDRMTKSLYLSQLQNIFVQIGKCTYMSKLQNILVQFGICICTNCKTYFLNLENLFEHIITVCRGIPWLRFLKSPLIWQIIPS